MPSVADQMEELLTACVGAGRFEQHWSCSGAMQGTRAGYAGTAVLTRLPLAGPSSRAQDLSSRPGLGEDLIVQGEGRHITLEFARFVLVTAYVPNAGAELGRLEYRLRHWDPALSRHLRGLEQETGKPVILAGDLNVAFGVRDIHHFYRRPTFPEELEALPYNEQYKGVKAIRTSAGLTPEERASFQKHYIDEGWVDAYRHCHPHAQGRFSYWSQRAKSRPMNRGLRLDYFLVSPGLVDEGAASSGGLRVSDCFIHDDDTFAALSDHCAVGLSLARAGE